MRDAGESSRLRVLVAMEPLVGGTLQHIEHLLAHTPPDEFELHLAVSAERDPSARRRFEDWRRSGWRVHEVPMRRAISPVRDLCCLLKLWALCRSEKFDLVHTHSSKAGFLGRLAAGLSGIPVVHTPHVFPFGRGAGGRRFLALEKLVARWTDRMVLLSDYQVNLVHRHRLLPADRVTRIPNGVDAGRLSRPGRARARAELGLEPGVPLVLFIGRLCEQKGLDVLLDAAGRLAREGDAARFLIVGDGPLGAWLEQAVARRRLGATVRPWGATDRAGVFYAACDLVVCPSRFEGMPYVILEAKAAARPTAMSLVSGMEEFVRHGWDGYLFPPESGEALAAVLRGLDGRRAELDEMGVRGREGLGPEWDARRAVRALHGVYRQVAEAGRRGG